MSTDPEHVSDGTTLVEVIRTLEADGYTAQMAPREGGVVRCFACHTDSPAALAHIDALCRTEGASDPDDMVAVVALCCPNCRAKGTMTLKYGPAATCEEDEVLRLLDPEPLTGGAPGQP